MQPRRLFHARLAACFLSAAAVVIVAPGNGDALAPASLGGRIGGIAIALLLSSLVALLVGAVAARESALTRLLLSLRLGAVVTGVGWVVPRAVPLAALDKVAALLHLVRDVTVIVPVALGCTAAFAALVWWVRKPMRG